MNNKAELTSLPEERIVRGIYLIRGKKVMLDSDLADLYGVTTKRLNEQVRRNIQRFPGDFMFQLDKMEYLSLRSQFATLEGRGKHKKYLPYVFIEHGILMLSSVLNSDRAIQVNIQIMRTFTRLRKLMATNELLRTKIEEMEKKYDRKFASVFRIIQHLLHEDDKPREEIGFKLQPLSKQERPHENIGG